MNALIVAVFATFALTSALPSGHLGGAVVAGPAGVVTSHGAIGPAHGLGLGGLGLGLAGHGVVAAPAVAGAVIAGPGAIGLGHAGLGLGLGLGHGAAAITNGGGVISASAHGATLAGPGTAPVVVAGPSGRVAAAGLWGPTHNVGLLGHGHGHGW